MPNQNSSLETLRNEAGISQAEMAAHLGISQSQVSRYEQAPDEVSVKVDREWRAFCGDVASSRALDVGDPMQEIRQRTQLITNYCMVAPDVPENFPFGQLENGRNLVSTDKIIEGIARISRKPRVGLFGRFDMGKSRLANLLMGGNNLPSSYQPATSIACLVRHIDDQPSWQPEPVWILGKGFDLNRPDDELHCKEHRIIGGGYDTLREHGTHSEKKTKHAKNAYAAVVYVDSPFLKGCDIIDLPGYQHQADDDARAEMAQSIVDIIIYVSLAQGFMDEHDRGYLAQLTRNLPAYESPENGLPPLCNLFVVATRADFVGNEIDSVLNKASNNSFDSIGDTLIERGNKVGVAVDSTSFRNRFFTFSAEQPKLRKGLENELSRLLTEICPKHILKELDRSIQQAKNSGTKSLGALIHTLQETLQHRDSARLEFEKVLAQEPERLQNKNQHILNILGLILNFKKESAQDAKDSCSKWLDPTHIEEIIKDRYDDKKKATELAPSYIVEKLQQEIGKKVEKKAKQLSSEVDCFLEGYDSPISDEGALQSSWDFNAKGAFAGALAGFGTFGALATWASVVAAGSNLGGYILAAKIVSALSAIGISVGGTATVASALSALGGPITIAVGLAVAVGVIAAAIFGDSWQRKLANRIAKGMAENDTESKIVKNLERYWNDTEKAFKHAAEQTETEFQNKLASLKVIAFNTDVKTLKVHLESATELKNFFGGIPWRRLDI